MNSSELTHAPPRRRSGVTASSSSPPTTPPLPSRNSYAGQSKRAPPPPRPATPPSLPLYTSMRPSATAAPTPVQGTTIYVFDPEDRFQRVQRRSLDQRPIETIEETRPDVVPSEKDDGEEANPTFNAYLSSSDEEQGQVRKAAAALPPAARRGPRTRDESSELRQLMEGLAKAPLRSRCSSGQSTGAPPTEKFDF
ncbi:hypothetical protein GN244_ATG13190 [Phytophthora infestans]|nr:hypothetical protein GN244_ATG13190 [Phytophthora infestans]